MTPNKRAKNGYSIAAKDPTSAHCCYAVGNCPEGCFGDFTGNSWVYYKAMVEN